MDLKEEETEKLELAKQIAPVLVKGRKSGFLS